MTLGILKLKSSLFYCDYVHLIWLWYDFVRSFMSLQVFRMILVLLPLRHHDEPTYLRGRKYVENSE